MADDIHWIETFWSDRLNAISTRETALKGAELSQATQTLNQARAVLLAAQRAVAEGKALAEEARRKLSGVAMPADTAALERDWEAARKVQAEGETAATQAARRVTDAEAALAALRAETAHWDQERRLAEAGQKAAKLQRLRLEALKSALQAPGFVAAQGGAAALLAQGAAARGKIDALLPGKMSTIITRRMTRDQAAAQALDQALKAHLHSKAAELEAMTLAGEALVASARELSLDAATGFAKWEALVPKGPGSPISADGHDLLVSRAGRNAAEWDALAQAEQKLADLETAELKLAAKRLAWPGPGEAGYTPQGPDQTAELAAVAAAKAAYAPVLASLAVVQKALVNIPDAWVDVSERHRALMSALAGLAKPLGAADAAAAVTALSTAVKDAADDVKAAAQARDEAAKWRRALDERRAQAAALTRQADARPGLRPGGIVVLA